MSGAVAMKVWAQSDVSKYMVRLRVSVLEECLAVLDCVPAVRVLEESVTVSAQELLLFLASLEPLALRVVVLVLFLTPIQDFALLMVLVEFALLMVLLEFALLMVLVPVLV